jgi:hypothetical protein
MDAVTVLRGIATLLVNPALGGGGIGVIRGAILLNQLATLVEGGMETRRELDDFSREIQALVDANGQPSRGQWDAMEARDAKARAALEANKEALDLDDEDPVDPPNDPPDGEPNSEPKPDPDAPTT